MRPTSNKREVVVFSADVVAQGVNQAGQQTRTQDVHVRTQRIRERDQFGNWHAAFGICDEGLALRFVQAQAAQDAAGIRDLVVDGIERVRADRAARRRGGNFFNAMEPGDFFDQIHLAFQVHAEGGNLEGGSGAFGAGDRGLVEQSRGVDIRIDQRNVRGRRTYGSQSKIFQSRVCSAAEIETPSSSPIF